MYELLNLKEIGIQQCWKSSSAKQIPANETCSC